MKAFHELLAELEAWLHHFRTHPEVTASVASAQTPIVDVAKEPVALVAAIVAPEATEDFTHRMLQAEYDSKPHEAPSAPVVVPALDFSDSTLDFNVVAGQNILVSGTVSKKFINCPTPVWVQTINGSGSTLTANDQTRTEPDGQALNRLTVTPVNGEINVTVVADDSNRTTLTVLAAPQ